MSVTRKTYPQLEAKALELVVRRVDELGSRNAVADEMGISRSGLSQAIDGKYPADAKRLNAKIIARYADLVICPAVDRAIPPLECAANRDRPLSACSANPQAVKHWLTCQSCSQNPARQRAVEVAS